MSGPLGRLWDRLASLFGGGAEADAAPDAAFVCTVCGTAVADRSGDCPLCGSTALEARDGADGAGEASATGAPGRGAGAGDGEPGPERRSVEGTTDDAVTRLRDVQSDGEHEGGDGSSGAGET